MAYLLGYDIGSSSVKVALVDAQKGALVAGAHSPEVELGMISERPGWAEQDPGEWWKHARIATSKVLSKSNIDAGDIRAIGITYQMHGLVIVDKDKKLLRPSIIWCDSRAAKVGAQAFENIGRQKCLETLLNSPGNFTASKLKWVKDNEPGIFSEIRSFMLPGDYIAMRMTGEINTTPSGLSEGVLWNFRERKAARILLDYYGLPESLLAPIVDTFSPQGELTDEAARELGLRPGTVLAYRAGDQPNNAFSLNVLNPGETATTAGTSGVIYSVTDIPVIDDRSRVNSFLHVNDSGSAPRYGVLLCINGTGILNRWSKNLLSRIGGEGVSYEDMNRLAAAAPPGCGELIILPFGNGAERILEDRDIGCSVHGLRFNTHQKPHFLRALQEGIVFALNYGLGVMRDIGLQVNDVRAASANMFLSPLFAKVFSAVTGSVLHLYDTDSAQGAARGAGVGAGIYATLDEAFRDIKPVKSIEPDSSLIQVYQDAYGRWLEILQERLDGGNING